ncbi:hypothetical protein BX616_007532, partial [Lobosporangium transversale]
EVEDALNDYRGQRYEYAKMSVGDSSQAGKLLYGQTWYERLLRKAVLNWMPKWLEEINLTRTEAYQIQATFLPRVPRRGTLMPVPQKPSRRYQEEQKLKESTPQAA